MQMLGTRPAIVFLSGTDRQVAGVLVHPKRRRSVMRTLSAVLAVALGVAVCVFYCAADANAQKGKGGGLAERIQDLDLTDAQEAKINEIRKEQGPKVKEAAQALAALVKDEMEKIGAVLNVEQKEKLKELKDEREKMKLGGLSAKIAHLKDLDLTDTEMTKIADIRKEYRAKIGKAMKELGGLLSDEQKKAREEALKAGKNRKEVWEAVKLTPEQKEKVEAVCKEVKSLVREELEQMKEVLTEEQKAKIEKFKDERKERVRDRRAHMIQESKDLNLSEDQKNQIRGIRKEFRPKVHEAGNQLRAAIREEVAMIGAVLKG
jgi:Spy/CpxP family protein refolding chaperone